MVSVIPDVHNADFQARKVICQETRRRKPKQQAQVVECPPSVDPLNHRVSGLTDEPFIQKNSTSLSSCTSSVRISEYIRVPTLDSPTTAAYESDVLRSSVELACRIGASPVLLQRTSGIDVALTGQGLQNLGRSPADLFFWTNSPAVLGRLFGVRGLPSSFRLPTIPVS